MLWFLIIIALTFILFYTALLPDSSAVAIIRFFGLAGLLLICVSLIIGPIVLFFPKWAEIIEPRRAVGLSGFVFILAHAVLVNYLYFDFDPGFIAGQFNLIFGSMALIVLLPVAISSIDRAISLLGSKKWKTVQRLTYIGFILALIHFVLTSNTLSSGNLASIFVLIIAILTIILQITGFIIKLKKSKEYRKN